MKSKEKKRVTYAARIYRADDWFMVEFPQLDLVTNGRNMDEALDMASDALEAHCTDYLTDERLGISLPESNLDIELNNNDTLAIVSVYVDPLLNYDMSTQEISETLGVNKQRISVLRSEGRIRAVKKGRDYLHNRGDVETLAAQERSPGRPKRGSHCSR